jgi:hypothetical protein
MPTTEVRGDFDVKVQPQPPSDLAQAAGIGRMSLDKHFHGPLEGPSRGEMLALMTEVQGSGVYVAIERFTGTLEGRSGSFALHHTGIMERGTPNLTVTVVPDSGTGELTGLNGQMRINIAGGKHSYEFEYNLNTPG